MTSRLRTIAAAAALVVAGCSGPSVSGTATVGEAITGTASDIASEGTVPAEPTEPDALETTESDDEATGSTEPAESEDPTEPAEPPAVTHYVYYVVDTGTELRLARELRDVSPGAEGAVDAVRLMIDGALDPDYATTWNPATTVNGVTVDGQVITVDLSGEARTANVGSGGAAIMVQQLVWTVTEAADLPDAGVLLLIDGADPGDLWGALTWEDPIPREQPEQVRMLVQIDDPGEGAQVTSPVTISGDAAAFEANVPWRILDSSGAEVDSGTTMTADGTTFSPYSFTVDLAPGDYTVEIAQDDPSDGEAGPPGVDTRAFTVTA